MNLGKGLSLGVEKTPEEAWFLLDHGWVSHPSEELHFTTEALFPVAH
jgi:hypothetical protein